MRLMNLRTNGRRLAVSPAHVRYVERDRDHVKVFIVDEAIPLMVTDTFDQVVKEWEDALRGRPYLPPREPTDAEDLSDKGPGGIFEGGLVDDEDIVDEQEDPTPAYGSPRYDE